MCNITGLDLLIANYIEQIIFINKTIYNIVFATLLD